MCGMNAREWLEEFLRSQGGVAGTVHRVVADDMMELDVAVNIPEPVQRATQTIPRGKGMAGMAMAEDRCVSTCNLREDSSSAIPPGARAVDAGAALAIPVHDGAGKVRAVVGIAWHAAHDLSDDELQRLARVAGELP
jgi:L-methionine (R)-S-oxide reductase